MANFDDYEMDLDDVPEAAGGEPAPVGTHLCRLTCGSLEAIGREGSQGFRIKGTVVEPNYRGRVTEDVLFWSDAAMPRIKLVLHRVAGIEHGKITARGIRDAVNGKLARMTVESVRYQRKGDKIEYSETQALELRAKGEKVYGHTKISFAGYESATAEEVAKYGEVGAMPTPQEVNGAGPPAGKLPF